MPPGGEGRRNLLNYNDFTYRNIIEKQNAAIKIAADAANSIALETLELDRCDDIEELKGKVKEVCARTGDLEMFLREHIRK